MQDPACELPRIPIPRTWVKWLPLGSAAAGVSAAISAQRTQNGGVGVEVLHPLSVWNKQE